MEDVNKIPNEPYLVMGAQNYRVTITNEDTGDIMYSHTSKGGVLCSVESMQILKESGEVEGNQQHLFWGNPVSIVHAFLMLKEQVEKQIGKNTFWLKEIHKAFNK